MSTKLANHSREENYFYLVDANFSSRRCRQNTAYSIALFSQPYFL